MNTPRRVLISVKYNQDQIVERSLAAYLKKSGYTTFRHEGTVDLVHRIDHPPFIAWGPLTFMVPSLMPSGRHTRPRDVSSSLIRYLVQQICSHSLVVVVWSASYARSFWCLLEMKAALLAHKPLLVICSDHQPLHKDLIETTKHHECEILDITLAYRTSGVASIIDRLLPSAAASDDSGGVLRELEKFVKRNYRDRSDSPDIRPSDCARYEQTVRDLRHADEQGLLHAAIQRMVGVGAWEYPLDRDQPHAIIQLLVRRGKIDVGLRQYLEDAASGAIQAQMEGWYYTYLLGEILDYTFLPPRLPERLREYYLNRIKDALTPPQHAKVQCLLDDLVQECLFTREFVEYFGNALRDIRRTHGAVVANQYWELCTSCISEVT